MDHWSNSAQHSCFHNQELQLNKWPHLPWTLPYYPECSTCPRCFKVQLLQFMPVYITLFMVLVTGNTDTMGFNKDSTQEAACKMWASVCWMDHFQPLYCRFHQWKVAVKYCKGFRNRKGLGSLSVPVRDEIMCAEPLFYLLISYGSAL